MSRLRLRVTLNKGKRGITLDKLEKFVEDLRQFLSSIGEDINLTEPNSWEAVEFHNHSLEFTSEYPIQVETPKLARFNGAVLTLSRSEFPPSLRTSTAEHFFDMAALLDVGELADMAVFGDDDKPVLFEISRRTATVARFIDVLPYRETSGAIQGSIHSLFKASQPPHFMLRELSTGNLVKCVYRADDYPAIVEALQNPDQVLHVRGTVVTRTRERSIDHIAVKHILLADSYGFDDVDKFLRKRTTQ